MRFNFTWLEDFLALAASGSFSRAAQVRNSSQPAFSRRIRALEDWIGVSLVDRSTQPATLTEVGAWFETVAQDLLARAARLPDEARKVMDASALTLRVASTHALSFTFLPRWLRGLEARLTLGPVELMSDVLARCEAQMQEGKVQFVLAHGNSGVQGPLDGEDYLSACIGMDQLVPVSAPAAEGKPLYLLGDGGGEEPLPVLAYTEASGMGRIMRAVLGRDLAAASLQVVFVAHLASVLRSMALDGRGVAWLPKTLIGEDVEAGRLVAATRDTEWAVELEIRLYRQRSRMTQAAEALWEAAQQSRVA